MSPSRLVTAPLAKRPVPPTAGDLQPRDKQQLSLLAVVGGFFFLERLKILLRRVDASLYLKVKQQRSKSWAEKDNDAEWDKRGRLGEPGVHGAAGWIPQGHVLETAAASHGKA